jgi:heptosyltransferase-2
MDYFRAGIFPSRESKLASEISKAHEILVIQTAFLGDVVLTLPFIQKLVKFSKVTFVVRKGVADLISSWPNLRVFEVTKGDSKSYSHVLSQIEDITFDICFGLHSSFRSALFAAKVKAKIKVGFLGHWSTNWIFDILIDKQISWPEPMRIMQMLQPFKTLFRAEAESVSLGGYEALNIKSDDGTLPELPKLFQFASEDLPNFREKKVAFFHGSQWGTKRWPLPRFLELQTWFQKKGFEVYWLGNGQEGDELRSVTTSIDPQYILAGQISLSETVNFLKRCAIVVSNDSGGGHLGALAGCKIISIFGPTSLSFGYRPWAQRVFILEKEDLDCRPCHHHGPQKCPLGHHRCMKEVSATSHVYEEKLAKFISF